MFSKLGRLIQLTLLSALSVVLVNCCAVYAETIPAYFVDMHLSKDGLLDITENVLIDFEDGVGHSIYRIIPTEYERYGRKYVIELKILDVLNAKKYPIPYTIHRERNAWFLQIGDPNQLLQGTKVCRIHYLVKNAISYIHGPELCWNATGDQWPCAIRDLRVRFVPPPSVKSSQLKVGTYALTDGNFEPQSATREAGDVLFEARCLNPGNSLYVMVGLPLGSVERPSWKQRWQFIFSDWWPALFIPLLSLIALTVVWWSGKQGYSASNQASNPASIVSLPENLSPAEIGTLIHGKCNIQEIVSTIVSLAERGYIRIEELESDILSFAGNYDYRFIKCGFNNALPNDLNQHEQILLRAIFPDAAQSALLSEIKQRLSKSLSEFQESVCVELMNKGQFIARPKEIRRTYFTAAIILMGLGTIIAMGPGNIWQAYGIGFLLTGIITWTFAGLMPALTALGHRTLSQIQTFRRSVLFGNDKYPNAWRKADHHIFNQTLPYAMVLGIADHWANSFQSNTFNKPSEGPLELLTWFQPLINNIRPFSGQAFMSDLGRMVKTIELTLVSVRGDNISHEEKAYTEKIGNADSPVKPSNKVMY